jgi:hypothetical protein
MSLEKNGKASDVGNVGVSAILCKIVDLCRLAHFGKFLP